jgi:transcriptional regulator with XRE-family HTH domain
VTPLDQAIRRARARRGWTQYDLATRVGTTPATVSRWERGRARPRWAKLRSLAQVLEVSPAELGRSLDGHGRPDPRLESVAARIAQALDELTASAAPAPRRP